MLKKGFFGIFEKLTVCFDSVPKFLYLFVSDSAELHSVKLCTESDHTYIYDSSKRVALFLDA